MKAFTMASMAENYIENRICEKIRKRIRAEIYNNRISDKPIGVRVRRYRKLCRLLVKYS